jgi:RNase P subunit RPR2
MHPSTGQIRFGPLARQAMALRLGAVSTYTLKKAIAMNNEIALTCPHCGVRSHFAVPDDADDVTRIVCSNCHNNIASVGQARAKIAQQAAGIGAGDLADDHVPIGDTRFAPRT